MKSSGIHFGHDVKEERVRIVVECLVVEEQLGQQAQVLSVRFIFPAVDFKKRNRLLSIDLIAWWMPQVAFDLFQQMLGISGAWLLKLA